MASAATATSRFLLASALLAAPPIAPPAHAESCCEANPGFPPEFELAPFPMIPGEVAATCFGGCTADLTTIEDPDTGEPILEADPRAFVLAVLETYDRAVPARRLPPAHLRGANWCAPRYHNEPHPAQLWNASNLGFVFGVALDRAAAPNIYLSSSTSYGDFVFPATSGGPGAVYRIDGTSGDICLYADLANGSAAGRGPGLGNVAYDPVHHQLFVSNFEDGLIYRLAAGTACGTSPLLDTWDHGIEGRLAAGLAPIADEPFLRFSQLERRVWAVQPHDGRLYYSTWVEDQLRAQADRGNEIWSVALLPTGAIDGATARLEVALPEYLDTWSMPVSDIAFSADGRMLAAEKAMLEDVGLLHVPEKECASTGPGNPAHKARVLEYRLLGGVWEPSLGFGIEFDVGECCEFIDPRHANGSGGVDYTCDGDIWTTGDALVTARPHEEPPYVYGLQWIEGSGNSSATVVEKSWFIDLNGDIGLGDCEDPEFDGRDDKSSLGDVETFDCDCQTDSPPVIVCADCELCNDPGLCSAELDCTRLATAIDPDGDPVTLTCSPEGPYDVGSPTEIVVTATAGDTTLSTTCEVTVTDCEPPRCAAPDPIDLECAERCGVRGDAPEIRRLLAAASGDDNCVDVEIDTISPPLFAADCTPGAATPVGYVIRDESGLEKTCRTAVTVVDTTPPRLTVPPPLTLECPAPGGVPADDPWIEAWRKGVTAGDSCSDVAWTDDLPPALPAACEPGHTTAVTFMAIDSCGNTTAATSSITVVDSTGPELVGCALLRPAEPLCPSPPVSPGSPTSSTSSSSTPSLADRFMALLAPAPPLAPASPTSPASAPPSAGCRAPTRATVVVDCGLATDACSAEPPAVEATLVLVRYEFDEEMCVRIEEEIAVECGAELELERLASPCAARPPGSPSSSSSSPSSASPSLVPFELLPAFSPASPLPPRSPGSPGSPRSEDPPPIHRGEAIYLRVRAVDDCGNTGECVFEATSRRGPLPVPAPPPACAGLLCCEIDDPPTRGGGPRRLAPSTTERRPRTRAPP